MTGSLLRRLQELADGVRYGSGRCLRATKEANLLAARQSAMNTAICNLASPQRLVSHGALDTLTTWR
jgi:hypothetical protein